MSDLFDTAHREKYKQYFVNDPLAFMKDAIDWSAFPPLLKDLYHNVKDRGGNQYDKKDRERREEAGRSHR